MGPGTVEHCGINHPTHTSKTHGRMERSRHGLPKVSLGLAMPNPFMPCIFLPLKQPSSTPLDTTRLTPMWDDSTLSQELNYKNIKKSKRENSLKVIKE
jgi:hypothetical protein